MRVINKNGELREFDPLALKRSLIQSGATKLEVEETFNLITEFLYDGITTRKLYDLAFTFLKKYKKSYAARYNLKKGISQLGPDGYFFEKYVSHSLVTDGFQFINGCIVKGKSIKHEIDIVGIKDGKLKFYECKFKNDIDAKLSVTTLMSFMSRVNDLKGIKYNFFGKERNLYDMLLVTNAYLTKDSIDWIEFYKLSVIAWNYPRGYCIKDLAKKLDVYPITCLTTLHADEKQILLKENCYLVIELANNLFLLDLLNITEKRQNEILLEIKDLLNYKINTDI